MICVWKCFYIIGDYRMITVSLETAKKMKKAGFDKYCAFEYVEWYKKGIVLQVFGTTNRKVICQAPTAQEILEDLYDRWRKPLLWIYPNAWKRTVQLDEYWDVNKQSPQRNEENIAEWVAKYWLRCKENGYLPSKTDD